MDKKSLSERDICTKYISPALKNSGWDINSQIREEFTLTNGRIIIRKKLHTRKAPKRADYVLFYKPNIPIAVIEVKDNNHTVGDGMQQALGYAEMLNVPFAFSTNGSHFLFHDKTAETNSNVENEINLNDFPSPETLWNKFKAFKGITPAEEKPVLEDYYSGDSDKSPRYYQLTAINKTIEAISKGQDRILLVMATGTGKTYTAFQIIWRLWKSKTKKRILFLADRNILVDQAITNDFKPFGTAMTKIKNRNADKSYEIYLSLYQAVTGSEEERNIYKQFSPGFFDLVIVDECHRGSAAENSAWRQILEYFSSATQIGLTATPKETRDVSNIDYFGDPIYTYSLRQGIQDGFLAPYKVIRFTLDKDLSWRPHTGMLDKYGNEIEDREYNGRDMDRQLILKKRTELVARKVSTFLKGTNRFDKTIIFCENIGHAERMRSALANENPDLIKQNTKYIMRITGDNDEGKAELDNFIFPESTYPVIATTSKLMTTGVDAQTCKLIVLDQTIESMTDFKQIIGRGTRIKEEYGKYSFTIMDFRNATRLFADPAFDGDPAQIYEPDTDESPVPPEIEESEEEVGKDDEFIIDGNDWSSDVEDSETEVKKYYVDNVPVDIVSERIQYIDANGKLITESLKDYTIKAVEKEFKSLDDFLSKWDSAEKKKAVIEELREQGVIFEALEEEIGKDFDPFDIICHIVWDKKPLTRRERVENVKKRNYFEKYGEQAKKVLEALLDKYSDEGVEHIEDRKILTVEPFTEIGTPVEIIETFGSLEKYIKAVSELEKELYTA